MWYQTSKSLSDIYAGDIVQKRINVRIVIRFKGVCAGMVSISWKLSPPRMIIQWVYPVYMTGWKKNYGSRKESDWFMVVNKGIYERKKERVKHMNGKDYNYCTDEL